MAAKCGRIMGKHWKNNKVKPKFDLKSLSLTSFIFYVHCLRDRAWCELLLQLYQSAPNVEDFFTTNQGVYVI